MELPKYVYAILAAIALFILLKDDLELAWSTIKFRRAWRRTALQIIHEMDERNTEWRVHVNAGTPSTPFHVQRKVPKAGDTFFQHWEWWTEKMFADPKDAAEFYRWMAVDRFKEAEPKPRTVAESIIDDVRWKRDVARNENLTVEQRYAMINGYSPYISHPSLGHVDGPGLPTWEEHCAYIEQRVRDAANAEV